LVKGIIAKGKVCLLDIDQQGAEKVHKQHPEWNYLFISPPSLEELETRLRNRGTEKEVDIKIRMSNAAK
jgi:guanylate kinase